MVAQEDKGRGARWIRRHQTTLLWLAAASLFLASVAAVYVSQQHDADHFRKADAAIVQAGLRGCQRANVSRRAVQRLIDDQIDSLNSTPAKFFPNIPPAVFQMLLKQRKEGLLRVRRSVHRAPCRRLYPVPVING